MMEMMDAAAPGRLKALWVIGYDVLLTNANASDTLCALRSLELLIVQDMFLNGNCPRVRDRLFARVLVFREETGRS